MKFTPIVRVGSDQHNPKSLLSCVSIPNLAPSSFVESPEVQRVRITIPTHQLSLELKHYQWRNRTEFPIVRVHSCQVVNSSAHNVDLQVQFEPLMVLLQELVEIPLFKALYLIKEAMIGFERIFSRFGPFKVNARMIGLDQWHKCRVWLSEELGSNHVEYVQLNEQGFIQSVCGLVEAKTVLNKNSQAFYVELRKCRNFSGVLQFIDQYSKEHRIVIPTVFKASRKNSIQAPIQLQTHKFHPSLSMSRAPRFINNIRDTLNSGVDAFRLIKTSKELEAQHLQQNVEGKEKGLENKQGLKQQLALKRSGETRADIYGSNTMTATDCKSKEDFLDSHPFLIQQDHKPQRGQVLQKSELLQFKSRLPRPTHKTTNKDSFPCFTPQPFRTHGSHLQWDSSPFLNPNPMLPSLQQKAIQTQLESLFQRNKWQQKVGGLFSSQDQMKKSVHQGGQPQWRDDGHRLSLLQNFGKAVFQSSLQEQR